MHGGPRRQRLTRPRYHTHAETTVRKQCSGDRQGARGAEPAEAKRATYDLCKRLFDNYRLDQTKPETTNRVEAGEILALLEAITDSPPMAEARRHLGALHGRTYERDAWQALIFDVWFRQFDDGRNRDLSGFEHIVVGEQKAGTVSGYHFWYKYYLDDWGLLGTGDDIDFAGLRFERRLIATRLAVPEVMTLAYRWRAQDFDTRGRGAASGR